MDLQTISALASGGFFIATYLIVQPLKLSINALQISVDRLASAMERVQDEVGENNEELARGEEKLRLFLPMMLPSMLEYATLRNAVKIANAGSDNMKKILNMLKKTKKPSALGAYALSWRWFYLL